MCQITFSNLHNPKLNSIMVYFLGFVGSKEKHDDGCGFICKDNTIFKTKISAHRVTNIGAILSRKITTNDPIPYHIRQATQGIEVNDENAHPFTGKHFILLHNGTLNPIDPKGFNIKVSDSLQFLNKLDDAKDANPKKPFLELFNDVMSKWYGKFAFIIREIETQKDYIIRGKTADLWYSEVFLDDKLVGYVINTSSLTLIEGLHHFVNVSGLMFGKEYVWTDPKLLTEETVFLAEKNKVSIVGKTHQNDAPKKEEVRVATQAGYFRGHNNNVNQITKSEGSEIIKLSVKIFEFLEEHSLSFRDLQRIVQVSYSQSLLEMDLDDLKDFCNRIIPMLSAPKKKSNARENVKKLLKGSTFPSQVYDLSNLQYPWMLNEEGTVVKALKSYFNEG